MKTPEYHEQLKTFGNTEGGQICTSLYTAGEQITKPLIESGGITEEQYQKAIEQSQAHVAGCLAAMRANPDVRLPMLMIQASGEGRMNVMSNLEGCYLGLFTAEMPPYIHVIANGQHVGGLIGTVLANVALAILNDPDEIASCALALNSTLRRGVERLDEQAANKPLPS